MVDIHTHIIPNVDDGSQDIKDTVKIFKEAASVGISDIVLTPHYIKGYYDLDTKKREDMVELLQKMLEKMHIPINVYIGNEIYICSNMDELILKKEVSCINNGKYVLFELPINSNIKYLDEMVFRLISIGKIPIIAHPERYRYVQKNIEIVQKLREMGALFQSNYGSMVEIYGKHAKKTLIKLLKKGYIDFLASDVHRPDTIYSVIDKSKNKIKKIIGEEALYKLTTENPRKIL